MALVAAPTAVAAPAAPTASTESVDLSVSAESIDLATGDSGLSDPFYQPPADMPNVPGALLRSEAAPHLIEMANVNWPGTSSKILYTSTNANGETVPVSGFVIEPTASWAGGGERPIFVHAPGTMGQGDQCAPSNQFGLLGSADLGVPTVGVNYEIVNSYLASALGMRVVVTDYVGMGTPGTHTYVNSDDEGHAVLDAGRAAREYFGASDDVPVAVFGYSQGGGAAAAAAERATSYAPDLNVKAAYSGAPPADIKEVLKAVDGNLIVGVVGYAMNSIFAYRPELAELIAERANEAGLTFIQETRTQCIGDSALTFGLTDSATLTKDGASLSALLEEIPEVGDYLDGQKLGQRPATVPIMVHNGINDDTIPFEQAAQMGRDFCAHGSHVSFHASEIPEVLPGSAVGHILPMVETTPKSFSYLYGALTGEQLPNDCGTF